MGLETYATSFRMGGGILPVGTVEMDVSLLERLVLVPTVGEGPVPLPLILLELIVPVPIVGNETVPLPLVGKGMVVGVKDWKE